MFGFQADQVNGVILIFHFAHSGIHWFLSTRSTQNPAALSCISSHPHAGPG